MNRDEQRENRSGATIKRYFLSPRARSLPARDRASRLLFLRRSFGALLSSLIWQRQPIWRIREPRGARRRAAPTRARRAGATGRAHPHHRARRDADTTQSIGARGTGRAGAVGTLHHSGQPMLAAARAVPPRALRGAWSSTAMLRASHRSTAGRAERSASRAALRDAKRSTRSVHARAQAGVPPACARRPRRSAARGDAAGPAEPVPWRPPRLRPRRARREPGEHAAERRRLRGRARRAAAAQLELGLRGGGARGARRRGARVRALAEGPARGARGALAARGRRPATGRLERALELQDARLRRGELPRTLR